MNNTINFVIKDNSNKDMLKYKRENKNWVEVKGTLYPNEYCVIDRNNIFSSFSIKYLSKIEDDIRNYTTYYVAKEELLNTIKFYAKFFPDVKFIYGSSKEVNLIKILGGCKHE